MKANLTITFTGDAHFGASHHNQQVFDTKIQAACCQSDYVVVNVESPITTSSPETLPGFVLHSDPECLPVLDTLGNLVLGLANNHAFDHGVTGLQDTIHFARERGWKWLGAGEDLREASSPCIVERDGVTVGILGVCWLGVRFAGESTPGVFGDSPEYLVRDQIRDLKRRSRWVVVLYHGGEEFSHLPVPWRRKKLTRYLAYGADVVVAHHAHCVQRYERVGDKYVFYGLGNLVFDLEHHRQYEGTDESVLLALSFSDRAIRFHPIFTRHDREKRRVLTIDSNPHFYEIGADSYRHEWELEAVKRLNLFWNNGHEGLARDGWANTTQFYWRKLRRVVRILLSTAYDPWGLIRPYVLESATHYLRRTLRQEPRREQSRS